MVTCCCCRLPHRSWTSNWVFIKKSQSNKCCPCGTNNSFNYFHMSILNSPTFPFPKWEHFWIVAEREYFWIIAKREFELLPKRSFLNGCQTGVFLNCLKKKVVFLNCCRKGVFLVRNARVTWVTTLTKSPSFPSLEVKFKNVEYVCYKNHFSKKKVQIFNLYVLHTIFFKSSETSPRGQASRLLDIVHILGRFLGMNFCVIGHNAFVKEKSFRRFCFKSPRSITLLGRCSTYQG